MNYDENVEVNKRVKLPCVIKFLVDDNWKATSMKAKRIQGAARKFPDCHC
jgi:hypothetical protein